jgi:1,4-dihydroxy-6-naphthoate synthase
MAKRDLGETTIHELDRLIQQSVLYAFEHPESVMPFVKQHAQAMDEKVMQQHIQLYVNDYTIDLKEDGKKAIEFLMNANFKNC